MRHMLSSKKSATNSSKPFISLGLVLLSTLSWGGNTASLQAMTPQTILSDVIPGPEWYQKLVMATKTVSFNKTGGDADYIEAVDLTYFSTTDCSGDPIVNGSRHTITNGNFDISSGGTFGLNTTSAYAVGSNLGVNMENVNSIAVVLKSSDQDIPQSNFSGSNYYCVPNVTCSTGAQECTSSVSTQDFTLKTDYIVGDPANGGVIACKNAGVGGHGYLIATTTDSGISNQWSDSNSETTATDLYDGASNTSLITNDSSCTSEFGCAALLCNNLSVNGGYTSDWFLPALNQLDCLYGNKDTITGFSSSNYWSSTEVNVSDAYYIDFSVGTNGSTGKDNNYRVRCVRAYTP